ncbi:unnamed protein product [Dicrocoelium dendriticum]|nr:unnamed protein product [Dicrocoelium dendriticum]
MSTMKQPLEFTDFYAGRCSNGTVSTQSVRCVIASIAGGLSAYVYPIVAILSLCSYLFIIAVLLINRYHLTRQLIYLFSMLMANLITQMLHGWLWLFSLKGLIYATHSRSHFSPMYLTTAWCTAFSMVYMFTMTLNCNLLALASLDRLLSIHYPLRLARVQLRTAWIAVSLTIVLTACYVLPLSAFIKWTTYGPALACWFPRDQIVVQTLSVLFSSSCIVQPLLVSAMNLAFYLRLRALNHRRVNVQKNHMERHQMRYTIGLFILSLNYIVFSMPIGVTTLILQSMLFSGLSDLLVIVIFLDFTVIAWNLFFLRDLFDVMMMVLYIPIIQNYLLAMIPRRMRPVTRKVSQLSSTDAH